MSKPDLLIIGGETAGFDLALSAAALGARVVLAEQDVPLAAPEAARLRAVGVHLLHEPGRFIGKRQFSAGSETVAPRYVVITNGATRPPAGIREGSGTRTVILGGGPPAVSEALALAETGQPALLVAPGPLLPGFEPDHVEWLRLFMASRQIDILEEAGLPVVAAGESTAELRFTNGRTLAHGEFGAVINHLDRSPSLASLDAAKAGLGDGTVDRRLRTANPRIMLAGDGIADRADAPPPRNQAGLVLGQALYGKGARPPAGPDARHVKGEPGLACFGLLPSALPTGERGRYRLLRASLPATDPARRTGLIVVTDRKALILGASAFGKRASELLAPLLVLAENGLPVTSLAALPLAPAGHDDLLAQIARQPLAEKLRSPAAGRWLRWRRIFG